MRTWFLSSGQDFDKNFLESKHVLKVYFKPSKKSGYRISSYSLGPWIVSAHLCNVTFGLMYCDPSPKKNSFRGNYMRKYGIWFCPLPSNPGSMKNDHLIRFDLIWCHQKEIKQCLTWKLHGLSYTFLTEYYDFDISISSLILTSSKPS